jgi:prefoldin subunit 1
MERLIDTQKDLNEISKKLNSIDVQIQSLEFDRKVSILTLRELSQIPDTIKTFKSCGKMFLKEDSNLLSNSLTTKIAKQKQEVESFQKQRSKLTEQIKEKESFLHDLVKGMQIKR